MNHRRTILTMYRNYACIDDIVAVTGIERDQVNNVIGASLDREVLRIEGERLRKRKQPPSWYRGTLEEWQWLVWHNFSDVLTA